MTARRHRAFRKLTFWSNEPAPTWKRKRRSALDVLKGILPRRKRSTQTLSIREL